jgi:energy-coupling factor transporter ATP-binding protein EcfA2
MIALDRVSKSYKTRHGHRVVLSEASVEFPTGCNIGVLGTNGSGKSTLIRLLAGSELPDRGRIRRHGRVSFPLGYGGTFHGSLSGRENVTFIARIYGADLRATTSYVAEFAELGSLEIQERGLAQEITTTTQPGPPALSQTFGSYETLEAEHRFAEAAYQHALEALDKARDTADRQQIYIASFVPPSLPEEALYPHRWRSLGVIALVAFAAWAIGALALQSIRNHL